MIDCFRKRFLCLLILCALSRAQRFEERISAKKCNEYRKIYGLDFYERVLGGKHAEPDEFPHFTAIGAQDEMTQKIDFYCSGSLISDRFVLTVAHCKKETARLFARIGIYIANPSVNGITDYEVEEFIVHENYSRKLGPDGIQVIESLNDIGLLKLVEEVPFSAIVRVPACLQQVEIRPLADQLSDVTIVGNYFEQSTGMWKGLWLLKRYSDGLLKLKILIDPLFVCEISHKSQICATENGSASNELQEEELVMCIDDSGSPLQQHIKGFSHSIVGLVSYQPFCGLDNPVVYTNVPYFLDWIESHVWPSEYNASVSKNAATTTTTPSLTTTAKPKADNSSSKIGLHYLLYVLVVSLLFSKF